MAFNLRKLQLNHRCDICCSYDCHHIRARFSEQIAEAKSHVPFSRYLPVDFDRLECMKLELEAREALKPIKPEKNKKLLLRRVQ